MSVPWYLMAKGKGGGGYKTASGPIVSVNDALAAPLRSLVANIEPVQDLHGYENPWPAGGGKNLLDYSRAVILSNRVEFNYGLPLIAGQPYTISYKGSPNINFIAYQHGASTRIFTSGYVKSYTFTLNEDAVADFTFYNNGDLPAEEDYFQLEKGSTATSYSPYSNICPISGWSAVNVWVKPAYGPTENPTATIQLGQTVYGGALDVTNGVLTVDRAIVDLGDLNWTSLNSEIGLFRIDTTAEYQSAFSGKIPAYTNNFLCTRYKNGGIRDYTYRANGEIFYSNGTVSNPGNNLIRAQDITLAGKTSGEIKTALVGAKLVYTLATPITIPLTATQISTLQGENNLWADSGDVTVEYLASGGTDPNLMKLAVAFMGRDFLT